MACARPGGAVAPVHADARAPGHAAAAADRARRRRLAGRPRRPPLPRCDQSSWWTNLFGHAEPRIAAAIARQAHDAGTRDPGRLLARAGGASWPSACWRIAPREAGRAPLTKVFYADNGSAGVEVALKMAFHWFRNRGETRRTKFVALENGYHGETHRRARGRRHSAVSPRVRAAAGGSAVRALARRLPVRTGRIRRHSARSAPPTRCAHLLERHAGEVCALILEPRVQCAGGMRMHDPLYLQLRARAVRCAWRVPDRRRDRGRLRPHRHAVRLRAGRHPAGPAVPVQGPDRRRPAAGGGAGDAGDLRRLPRRFARTRLPAFAQLHRQPARLRGGAGVAGHLRRATTCSRATAAPRQRMAALAAPLRRPSACRRRAPGRHDRRVRADAERRQAHAVRSGARASACAPIARRWSAAWCCARSATCCTGCRRTASTRKRCSSWRDAHAHRPRHRGGRRHAPDPRPRRCRRCRRRARSRCPRAPPRT